MELSKLKKCDMSKPYVFVSYSSSNRDLVWEDVYNLQQRGYNIWIDDKMIDKTKSSWENDAIEAITTLNCKLLIFYVSRDSLSSKPCLNEMKATISEKAKKFNRNEGKLKFIAVDAEEIENFDDFTDELFTEYDESNNSEKYDILYDMCEGFFNTGNARVRILNKYIKNRKTDYYSEIEICIPDRVKNQDVVSSRNEVEETENTIENVSAEEQKSDELPEHDEKPAGNSNKKKFSVTGDITYSLFGKEYTDNQSDMMLRFFGQVLMHHQDKVATLPECKGMNCASRIDYTKQENRNDSMPSYFRVCHTFSYDNGESVCIGTAYGIKDKLSKMANLLAICGESGNIFSSEQVELPLMRSDNPNEKARRAASTGDITYTLYGKEYTDNQSNMMINFFKQVLSRHQDKVSVLPECKGMNCASHIDYTKAENRDDSMPSYFRICDTYTNDKGEYVCIGTSYGIKEKMTKMSYLLKICDEEMSIFSSDDVSFSNKERKVSMNYLS